MALTQIKKGVSLLGLTNAMSVALSIVATVCHRHNVDCVITAGTEGSHSRTSLHYLGNALDFRTRDILEGLRQDFRSDVAAALNGDDACEGEFDIVLESDHLHVEFQPKRGSDRPVNS